LVAAGRRPQIDGLELGAAGVAATDKGITTDSAMRTSNPRIFAIGDVAGSYRFTHWAGYQGGLVVRTILTHVPARENKSAIAWATYTDPELAHVGLTEAEAREKHGRAVQVLRWPYQGNDRAQAELETDGLVKVITGRRGRILGADIAGAGAGEMAALFALAIAGGLGTRHLSAMVLPYPTLAEAAKRAAVSGYAAKLESGLAQRVLGALRRFI
jgi:pyruvate/2-oxoglutarate dehydrogenase complex dihydrolipoamide dehydrogenase (E3) component